MGITRRRSPKLFAGSNLFLVIISIFVCADMGSATRWKDICTLGDTYIERSYPGPSTPYSCDYCIDWCNRQCSSFGTTKLKNPCNYVAKTAPVDCQCCCSKRPSSSPQLPPTPPSAGQFTGGDITNICTPDQTYLPINHTLGTDCVLTPQCENKCQEAGLLSAGSQCVGASIFNEAPTWIEQCCCRPAPPPPPPSPSPPPPPTPPPPPPPTPSPPPPSPSPPPPSPYPPSPSPPPPSPCPSPTPGTCCGSCNSDINIQISVTSGCNVKL
ncbi:hypothetical protein MKW94_015551 [Papaver nudicaule]|uniref:Uncharacterized protein n=1 Tax=Papaver nudicaule TaxID=74823 RepID=A0AA41VFJ0_PAPNU|nr:hypothetical protein [Papaver nudicaule]